MGAALGVEGVEAIVPVQLQPGAAGHRVAHRLAPEERRVGLAQGQVEAERGAPAHQAQGGAQPLRRGPGDAPEGRLGAVPAAVAGRLALEQHATDAVGVVPLGEARDQAAREAVDVERVEGDLAPVGQDAAVRDLDRDVVAADHDPHGLVVVLGEGREDLRVVGRDLGPAATRAAARRHHDRVGREERRHALVVLGVDALEVARDQVAGGGGVPQRYRPPARVAATTNRPARRPAGVARVQLTTRSPVSPRSPAPRPRVRSARPVDTRPTGRQSNKRLVEIKTLRGRGWGRSRAVGAGKRGRDA